MTTDAARKRRVFFVPEVVNIAHPPSQVAIYDKISPMSAKPKIIAKATLQNNRIRRRTLTPVIASEAKQSIPATAG